MAVALRSSSVRECRLPKILPENYWSYRYGVIHLIDRPQTIRATRVANWKPSRREPKAAAEPTATSRRGLTVSQLISTTAMNRLCRDISVRIALSFELSVIPSGLLVRPLRRSQSRSQRFKVVAPRQAY